MSPYFKYTAEDSKGRYIVEHGRADAPIEIAKKLRKKGYHMRSIKEIDGLSSDNTESKKIFNKKNVKLKVNIPPNTKATIDLSERKESDKKLIEIGSGDYEFNYEI